MQKIDIEALIKHLQVLKEAGYEYYSPEELIYQIKKGAFDVKGD